MEMLSGKSFFSSPCLQPKHSFRLMLSKACKCSQTAISSCDEIVFFVISDREYAGG